MTTTLKSISIKRGLDLPILGAPEQRIEVAKPVTQVALLGDDYVGMKPTMLVAPGDRVALGQPIFRGQENRRGRFHITRSRNGSRCDSWCQTKV